MDPKTSTDASSSSSSSSGQLTSSPQIEFVPPPWSVKGDIYLFSFWTSKSAASTLPEHAYSPLEAASDFASSSASGSFVGGLGMVQILRYRDSPVGPYDEMLLVPGSFEWKCADTERRKPRRGVNPRITRMYVSQRGTCYNGRLNWNCPKHLAKFDWTDHDDGSTSVKIYPHDTASRDESAPSAKPFFQTTFKPIKYTPSFSFATHWSSYLGLTTRLVMPPLPGNREAEGGEVVETDTWCSFDPVQVCKKVGLGWFDVAQGSGESEYENFWPGWGGWQVGMKMEGADLVFEEPEVWAEMKTAKL